MKCIVIRRACLPEDEGREEIVEIYNSVLEARNWIDAQENEYFKPQDYYVRHLREEEDD